MGQKIHPGGLRVGVIHDWKSNWYTGKKEFADYILEDVRIREHITGKLSHAGLSDILIRKDKQRITVDIYTARPGIVIGRKGADIEKLKAEVQLLTGQKEVLGMWVANSEGAKFWLHVLTELKNRGVRDIFIGCVDGIKGFPEAMEAVFPATQVQLCLVHMVRNSLSYVGWKERAAVAAAAS